MVKDNVARVRENIDLACKKVSLSSDEIALICVTKGVEIAQIIQAMDCGIRDIGENRVQEAASKYLKLKELSKENENLSKIKWHMVGHLQTNKAIKALEIFDMIQSVDSLRLAQKIDSEAKKNNKIAEILLEINTSAEKSKFGVKEQEVFGLIQELSKLKNIQVLGLMTIGPFTSDENKIRQSFCSLRELRDRISKELLLPNIKMQYLSMGMTDDYQIAIEEGSNMIRLGRAIFSDA